MENRYKIVITNKRIYKEVDLHSDNQFIKVGTTRNCDARFSKDLFFEDFEIIFENLNSHWNMSSTGNIYFSSDGVLKLSTKDLSHGDELTFKYTDSNQEIFKLSFMIDFDYKAKDYNRIIDIAETPGLTIGGSDQCNICISDELFGRGQIMLTRKNDQLIISDNNTKYGVFVNGQKVKEHAQIYDYDFISIIGYSFYYKFGKLYTTVSGNIKVNGLSSTYITQSKTQLKFPKFNLSSRVKHTVPESGVSILPPEQKPEKPKSNIIMNLVPVLVMIALTVVLRGVMGGGGTFVIFSVCTMGMGAMMTVITMLSERKKAKTDEQKRIKNYNSYIQRKESEIRGIRDNELRVREQIFLSVIRSLQEIEDFGKRLFEKKPGDNDFLKVYIGRGDITASCRTKITEQEFIANDDALTLIPEQIRHKYTLLQSAPIASDFNNSCGIVGKRETLAQMLKNITIDVAARHFYKDVKLFYIFDDNEIETFKWVKWLPHVKNESLGVRNIICDEESRNILLEYLYSELSSREAQSVDNKKTNFSHFVVFVYNAKDLYTHPISKYIENSSAFGFTFVFFEEYEECLPSGLKEIIKLNEQNYGELIKCENGEDTLAFNFEYTDNKRVERSAVKLGAIYIDEVTLEGEMTKNISLFQLLNIFSCEDLDLTDRWSKSQVWKSMAAPLGVKRKNEIVYLNINDKTDGHGPHGLVAGTTGSGKSEILQSYVLSMATLFHPYDVGFVMIDFKGGGMANQFKDLPHLIGTITNIDGREINRSLLSIKAELIRRQELFSKYGVNHIDNYIKLFREGKTDIPLPHMIMIVDEFAELKMEYPDFMKEIVSAARIGRTLGVHLILATQKPAGVVDDQIWSNSKFKLCLKVQTKEDSRDVIKSPLAAEIVEPGRAYFQVGNNEIFELFQSAYSGAKVLDGSDTDKKEYEIFTLNDWGKKSLLYTNKSKQRDNKAKNQLDAIVEYISKYCKDSKVAALPGICLPPLADSIFLKDLERPKRDIQNGIVIPIGFFDDPEQQRQQTLKVDVSKDNIQIIGTSQMGKTTLLQTAVYSLMENYSPEDVNIYIFDGGNMAMKVFENAHHIGGVALPSEEEKVKNLFKMLASTSDERKEIFAGNNVGTYKAYIEAGFFDLPQIVVVIDNVSVFREHYADLEDDLLRLTREGPSVGINFIISGTQANSLGYRIVANFGEKVAFTCNDKSEYSTIFGRCKIEPKEIPGRGLVMLDKRILEFQAALCVEGEKEIDRANNIKRFIEETNNKYADEFACKIPIVPEKITISGLLETQKQLFANRYALPAGMDYDSVAFEKIDLASIGAFAVMGKESEQKVAFVKQMLTAIKANPLIHPTQTYIIDDARRNFASCKNFGFVEKYTIDSSEAEVLLYDINEILEKRRKGWEEAEDQELYLSKLPLILIIIENTELISSFSTKKEFCSLVSNILLNLTKRMNFLKACIVFTSIENEPVGYNSPEVIKIVRDNKKAIIFDNINEIRFLETALKQQKEFRQILKPQDAYYFNGSAIKKIKTICDE